MRRLSCLYHAHTAPQRYGAGSASADPGNGAIEMAGRDLDYFMGTDGAWDALSDEDKATLFNGGVLEGDTTEQAGEEPAPVAEESSEAPAAAEEPQASSEAEKTEGDSGSEEAPTPAADEAPVVLTKDGKHAIPFAELESAREQAKHWERFAKEQQTLIERLQVAQPSPAEQDAAPAAPAFDLAAKEKQYIERALAGDYEGAAQVRAEINAEIRREAEAAAIERAGAHAKEVTTQAESARLYAASLERQLTTHPYLNDNEAALAEVAEWRDFYLDRGELPHAALAQAFAKVAPMYKPPVPAQDPNPAPKPAAPAAADLAAKAAEVVAAAKPKAPTSLSEVPAGTAAPHDEVAAIREMTGQSLMGKFTGKTPDQIMDLLNRVI